MHSAKPSPYSTSRNTYLIWFVFIIAAIALALLMRASGNGQTTEQPESANKQWVKVVPISWHQAYVQQRSVIGRVEAQQSTYVGFDLAGLVANVLVDEGQDVTKGQVLAKVDTQRLNAQLNELSAQLNRTKADAKLAALSFERVQNLVANKLESAQRLDESREALKAADARVDEVFARQATLLVELDKTQLKAPFDGSVAERLIDEGTVVSAGQALFNIQQNDDLEVRFAVPANQADKLAVGQLINADYKASAQINSMIKCRIISVSKRRRLDTRTVDVIAKIIDPQAPVLPGDLLSFSMNHQMHAAGVWVPRTALVSGVRGLWSIFITEDAQDGHVLVAKLAEIIYADDQQAYIKAALLEGDKVVTEGVHKLVPGQSVLISTHSSFAPNNKKNLLR